MRNTSRKSKATKALDKDLEREFRAVREGSRRELSPTAQKYLSAMVQPERFMSRDINPESGPLRTKLIRLKEVGTFGTGSTSFAGFVIFNPFVVDDGTLGGFYNDRTAARFTNNSATGYTDFSFPNNTMTAFTSSEFTAATRVAGDLGYHCTGASLTIWPEESVTNLGGTVYMGQSPGNSALTSWSFTQLQSYDKTTSYSLLNFDPEKKFKVFWVPQSSNTEGSARAGFAEAFAADATAGPAAGGLYAFVNSTKAGSNFRFEIVANYEVLGKLARGQKPRIYDSRGRDLVFNALAQMRNGSHIRPGHEVTEGLLAHIYHTASSLAGKAVTGLRKEAMDLLKGLLI